MRLITRLVAWAFGFAAGIIALLFVIESREPVTLAIWGLPEQIQVPLFFAVLVAGLVGFFCGAIVMWFCDGRSRRLGRTYLSELRASQKEADKLKEELAAMRKAADAADQSRANANIGQIGVANTNHPPMLPGRAL
jgi:uncharacterized integral membrane protein